MLVLDHIAVLGETLEEAATHVETCLGQPMLPGGRHERFGTHNRLLGLDPDLYLEAIAVDPSAPKPEDARWFGLDHFQGAARLDKWICRVADIDAALETLPEAGRRVDVSRGALHWAMAVPEDGKLPFDGMFPALIQWKSDVLPGKTLQRSGYDLTQLVVRHPNAADLSSRLAPFLETPCVRIETAEAAGLQAVLTRGDGAQVVLK